MNRPTVTLTARRCGVLLSLSALILSMVTPLGAQTTASIFGSVTDEHKGVVAGARITATNRLTNESRTTETNDLGYYSLPGLALGLYTVRAERPGFKTGVRDGIELSLNRNARVDLELVVGTVGESVTVTADAPLVESITNEMGARIDRQRVVQLPLNGRNTLSLVSLIPGARQLESETTQGFNINKVAINGIRPELSNWLLDGGDNTTPLRNYGNPVPNPDAVQEFRVISNNYSAEYGRTAGAVVNVVTKSGTNEFHGGVFEFHRNRALNARNFFEPDTTPLVQNQFGGAFGGPIVKDRTFFFGAYQGFRRRTSAFRNSALAPTAAERGGDFSQSFDRTGKLIVIRDPMTRQPFQDNRIPQNRLSPVALNFLKLVIPLPNAPLIGPNAIEQRASVPNDNDQFLVKLDHLVSASHKLSGGYFWSDAIILARFPSGNIDFQTLETKTRQHNLNLHEYWTLSPTLLNHFRLSFSRTVGESAAGPTDVTLNDLGAKFSPLPEGPIMPPSFNVTGYFNAATPFGGLRAPNHYTVSDTVDWVKGRHNLKFGGELWLRKFVDLITRPGQGGQLTFDGTFSGNSLADLLLGQVKSLGYASSGYKVNDSWAFYGFIQDNLRAGSRLVLNLGLRYELDTYPVTPTDTLLAYIPGRQSTCVPQAPAGIVFPCDEGVPRAGARNDYNNFAPRFGLAYDLFGDGKTVIRAGYGVSYAFSIFNVLQEQQVSTPFSIRETLQSTTRAIDLSDPYATIGGSPFPARFDPARLRFPASAGYAFQDFNLRTGYVQQYNLSVQRQLGKDWMTEVAYVGNVGRKLSDQRDINAPLLLPGASAANINQRRPLFPTFLEMRQTEGQANSSYNALQARVEKRFSQGFTVLGAYTFEKSIDLASWHDSQNQWADPRNLKLNRGLSDFNRTNSAVISWVWELPLSRAKGVTGALLGGWSLNGIAAFYSGRPVGDGTASNGITTGRDNDFDGNGNNDRPDLVGDWRLSPNRPRGEVVKAWFETRAFIANQPGKRGSLGRNLVIGPGSRNLDLGIFKTFRLSEKQRVEFRAETFNAFNWVNLGNPEHRVTNANFGRILSAGPPRIFQFGLKYNF